MAPESKRVHPVRRSNWRRLLHNRDGGLAGWEQRGATGGVKRAGGGPRHTFALFGGTRFTKWALYLTSFKKLNPWLAA